MKKLFMMIGAAAVSVGAYADYAVSPATSSPYTSVAIYTSRAAIPTFACSDGALADPFLITYKDGETVSVTAPNGVTTDITPGSYSDGTISYTPASGGLWTFANSNGSTAYIGVSWAADMGDGFVPVVASGTLSWLDTELSGPDRRASRFDNLPIAFSDVIYAGGESGTVTLTLTSPSGEVTTYVKASGEDAKTLRLRETGVWTVALATSTGTSTARINVVSSGLIISFR